jgi:cytosine/adenosine deaminase-related metal-dependent hydrolase
LNALPAGSIVAHGVHLDEHAVRRCSDEGLWLVQNPRSNHGNRVGYPHHLRYSHRVALGTDGYPAVMTDEESALWLRAREAGDDDSAVAQRVDAGWSLVAEHFALPFAPLQPGCAADLVVRSATGQVRHVFAAGRLVVRDAVLVSADLAEIVEDAKHEASRLWQIMTAL